MLLIFETEIPNNKSIYFSLQYIFGIGKSQSFLICKKLGFSINLKVKELSQDQIVELSQKIKTSHFSVSGDLKKVLSLTNAKLLSIKSYRGLRKSYGLPIRGQRTHSNSRTARKKFLKL